MTPIARILDANLNRAAEALRVMEDVARFGLDRGDLAGELKALRHDLRAAMDALPLADGVLIANRDVAEDVGTFITARREQARSHLLDVAAAAGSRATQALRVLEECAKTIDAEAGGRIESLRYRTYAVDQSLQLALGSGRARPFRLCVILTQSLCRRPWREVLTSAVEHGADCVQVREKGMADGKLIEHVREVIRTVRAIPRRATVIVNDRADIGLIAGADGVHLGTGDLSIQDVRRIAGRQLLIGASTHTLEEARVAVHAGADYCGVGAMFASSLKPDRAPSGAAYLREFIERYPEMPCLAIGGITPGGVGELIAAVQGFPGSMGGIAVSTAICAAEDPGRVAQEFLKLLLPSACAANPG